MKNGEPQDDLSDDDLELQGDFVNESGKQVLFTDIPSDCGEYESLPRGLDHCYKSSLLLLDGSVNKVGLPRCLLVGIEPFTACSWKRVMIHWMNMPHKRVTQKASLPNIYTLYLCAHAR